MYWFFKMNSIIIYVKKIFFCQDTNHAIDLAHRIRNQNQDIVKNDNSLFNENYRDIY